jgi:hypothetical protein
VYCDADAGAMELHKLLCAAFDVDLPVTITFDYPTVDAISRIIASALAAEPVNVSASAANLTSTGIAQLQYTVINPQSPPSSSYITATVKRLVAEVLGGEDRIGEGTPLVEAGIDSFSEAVGCADWMTRCRSL